MLHTNDRIVKHKVGLLNVADELGNISKACKMMGVSRETFYRCKEAVNDGGVDALFEKSRRIPNHKNRVDPAVESVVVAYAIEEPAHGQVRVSNELRKRSVFVSPGGVRSIWFRYNLANLKQRLKALEAKVAESSQNLRYRLLNASSYWAPVPIQTPLTYLLKPSHPSSPALATYHYITKVSSFVFNRRIPRLSQHW